MLKQKKGSWLSNCSKHSENKNSLLLVNFLSFFIFLCRKIFSYFSKCLLTFSSQSSCIKSSSNKQLNVSSDLKSFSTYAYKTKSHNFYSTLINSPSQSDINFLFGLPIHRLLLTVKPSGMILYALQTCKNTICKIYDIFLLIN